MTTTHLDHLEKVYYQASEWIRLCNVILWAMGTVLVPISAACIGLALQFPDRKFFLAPASVFIFAFWVYASRLYRATAASAREVLMNIENEWEIEKKMALYKLHGQVGLKRLSLFNTQVLCLILLIILWSVLLILLHKPTTPKTIVTVEQPGATPKTVVTIEQPGTPSQQ